MTTHHLLRRYFRLLIGVLSFIIAPPQTSLAHVATANGIRSGEVMYITTTREHSLHASDAVLLPSCGVGTSPDMSVLLDEEQLMSLLGPPTARNKVQSLLVRRATWRLRIVRGVGLVAVF